MPYLNWKQHDVRKHVEHFGGMSPGAGGDRSTLTLTLDEAERTELIRFLEELFLRQGTELRLDLPDNWIVFWKTRESESRLLLAHPQRGEFVTTIALEAEHGSRVIEALRGLSSGGAFSVSEQGVIGMVSNVEVILSMK